MELHLYLTGGILALNIFDEFTKQSKNVLHLAQEEATRWKHDTIGTEHILLGLIKENDCTASRVLKALNVNSKKIEIQIEELVGEGENGKLVFSFSPIAKQVIELAGEESNKLGHNYIDTEHILIALIRKDEGVAAQILKNLSINLEQILRLILSKNDTDIQQRQRSEVTNLKLLLSSLLNNLSEVDMGYISKNVKGLREWYNNMDNKYNETSAISNINMENEKITEKINTSIRVKKNTSNQIKALIQIIGLENADALIKLLIKRYVVEVLTAEEKEGFLILYEYNQKKDVEKANNKSN